MDRKDLEAKVLQAVACVMPEIDISKLDMTAELTKEYGVNSVSIIQLIVELENDFKINDGVVQKIKGDINFYFDKYAPNDNETKEFTKYISLYLALIVKKPLHPYGNDPKKDEVYMKNNSYYCKGRAKFIKDQKSLCRYCICKNPPFAFMF